MGHRLPVAAVLAALALTACGGTGGNSAGGGGSFTPAPGQSTTPGPGGTAASGSASPGSTTGTNGSASPGASRGATPRPSHDRFCDFPARVRCTQDAAFARNWWIDGAMLEVTSRSIPYTYVLLSPKGFGPEVDPKPKDGTAFNIIFHPRGGDPRTTVINQIVFQGGMLVTGVPVDQPRTLPPTAGRRVRVQGTDGVLVKSEERDGRPASRLVTWSESVNGKHVFWTAASTVRAWPSDDEFLAILNGLKQ